MDATLNPANQEQPVQQYAQQGSQEKSELMQVYESLVYDPYWAYRDLLKEILDKD